MVIGWVAKLALVGAMAVTTFWGDSIIVPAGTDCDFNCCVIQCVRDSSTGCNGSSRCCENLCR